jgi:TM2 domain-containing membrane protein YozV
MSNNNEQGQPAPVPVTQQEQYLPTAPAFAPTNVYQAAAGEKSFVVTWLLSLLLGGFAVDRFYLGKIGTGILKLITFSGFGIWYLIDLILVLANAQTDKAGNKLAGYEANKMVAWIVSAVVVVLSGLGSAVSGMSSLTTLN